MRPPYLVSTNLSDSLLKKCLDPANLQRNFENPTHHLDPPTHPLTQTEPHAGLHPHEPPVTSLHQYSLHLETLLQMVQSPKAGAEPLDIEPLEVKFSDDETNDEKMQHEINEDDDMQEAQSQPEEEAEGKDQVSDSQFI
jgi:hypothetical protein